MAPFHPPARPTLAHRPSLLSSCITLPQGDVGWPFQCRTGREKKEKTQKRIWVSTCSLPPSSGQARPEGHVAEQCPDGDASVHPQHSDSECSCRASAELLGQLSLRRKDSAKRIARQRHHCPSQKVKARLPRMRRVPDSKACCTRQKCWLFLISLAHIPCKIGSQCG